MPLKLPVSQAANRLWGFRTIPLVLAVFIGMGIFSSGILDEWILAPGPRGFSPSPHPGGPLKVPVQKASLTPPNPGSAGAGLVSARHKVGRGETLSRIAFVYGLTPSTLISVNRIQNPEDLKTGDLLIIPYRDGSRVKRQHGDTAETVAGRLGTAPDMVLRIPGERDWFVFGAAAAPLASLPQDNFIYPVSGRVLTAFGSGMDNLTGIPFQSEGLDLSARPNTPVIAAKEGVVRLTGHHSFYGYYLIMSHPGGWRSFYGHLSQINAVPGDELEAGETLGLVGKSGSARSPRLHFALIHNGEPVDPLDYLY